MAASHRRKRSWIATPSPHPLSLCRPAPTASCCTGRTPPWPAGSMLGTSFSAVPAAGCGRRFGRVTWCCRSRWPGTAVAAVAALITPELTRRTADPHTPAGWYGEVTDASAPWGSSARRVLDATGRLPAGLVLLRPRSESDPDHADPDDGPADGSGRWTGSADQVAFRDRVLTGAIADAGSAHRCPTCGAPSSTTSPAPRCSPGPRPRRAVEADARRGRAALRTAQQAAGDADALRTVGLTVGSGYRPDSRSATCGWATSRVLQPTRPAARRGSRVDRTPPRPSSTCSGPVAAAATVSVSGSPRRGSATTRAAGGRPAAVGFPRPPGQPTTPGQVPGRVARDMVHAGWSRQRRRRTGSARCPPRSGTGSTAARCRHQARAAAARRRPRAQVTTFRPSRAEEEAPGVPATPEGL